MTSNSDTSLFDATLISPAVQDSLPEGYSCRPLRKSDYETGFLGVLTNLTSVGDYSLEDFESRFNWMLSQKDTYFCLCITDINGQVVGTGTVFIERKFTHNLGSVGHIEDIAVRQDQRGKKLGLRINQALDFIARKMGCYKSILNCSEANEGFYLKCGFKRSGLEMARYYDH